MSKHFPDRAKRIGPDQILAIADAIKDNRAKHDFVRLRAARARRVRARRPAPLAHSLITFTAKMPDNKSRPLAIRNAQFAHAEVPADAKSVHVEGDTDFALFYQLTEAGFDLAPPASGIKNQIEVFREFENEKGEVGDLHPVESKVDV